MEYLHDNISLIESPTSDLTLPTMVYSTESSSRHCRYVKAMVFLLAVALIALRQKFSFLIYVN